MLFLLSWFLLLSSLGLYWGCIQKWTYSENSPQIQAAAYSTSQMPIRCMLPVKRWALSSRVAIWATAKARMALTRIATSSIWEAMRWPCRVPSNRVSSTRMLIYLSENTENVWKNECRILKKPQDEDAVRRLTTQSWWYTGSCSGCRCRWSWWGVRLYK